MMAAMVEVEMVEVQFLCVSVDWWWLCKVSLSGWIHLVIARLRTFSFGGGSVWTVQYTTRAPQNVCAGVDVGLGAG